MNSNTYQFAKHFGIISLIFMIIFIAILCYIYYKKEGKVLSSISATVADKKHISLMFSLVMTLGIPMYYLGILLFIIPKYNLPFICSLLLVLAFCFEMMFIWIPSKDKKTKYHSILTTLTSLLMVIEMVLILILVRNINLIIYITIIVLFILSIINFLIYKTRKKKNLKYTFLFEIAFISFFVLIFLILTYF